MNSTNQTWNFLEYQEKIDERKNARRSSVICTHTISRLHFFSFRVDRVILHILTICTHIVSACRMRMLNDFYFDIDNIMGKQASPYKIHPCNNIKVFFSVILVANDVEGCFRIYEYEYIQSIMFATHEDNETKIKARPSTHTMKNSNIICLFCNSTH